MDNKLYDYSPIVSRSKIAWPNGARLAFYIGLNIEHFEVDKPATSIFGATAGFAPDPLNYGWRDYGVRVGIWRMMEALDKYGMRASVLLNADVCTHYPQIIEAGRKRNWAWLAHGKNNSTFQVGMNIDEERKYLKDVVTTIASATGQTIRGWLGPALTETFETPRSSQGAGTDLPVGLVRRRSTLCAECSRHDVGAVLPGSQRHHDVRWKEPVRSRFLSDDRRPIRPPLPRQRTVWTSHGALLAPFCEQSAASPKISRASSRIHRQSYGSVVDHER